MAIQEALQQRLTPHREAAGRGRQQPACTEPEVLGSEVQHGAALGRIVALCGLTPPVLPTQTIEGPVPATLRLYVRLCGLRIRSNVSQSSSQILSYHVTLA